MSDASKIRNDKLTYKRRVREATLQTFTDHLDKSYEIDENLMLKTRHTKEQDNE